MQKSTRRARKQKSVRVNSRTTSNRRSPATHLQIYRRFASLTWQPTWDRHTSASARGQAARKRTRIATSSKMHCLNFAVASQRNDYTK